MENSVYTRARYFDQPFVYIVENRQIANFCSYCLRKPEKQRSLQFCGACRYSRYCDKNCQRLAWAVHKPECKRLQVSFPNLPLSEVMFLCRMLDRVRFIKEKGDVHKWQKDRRFDELMSHAEDIKKDEAKMAHFEKTYLKTCKFMGDQMVEKEEFFEIFAKSWINSHSIHTNAGTEIGMALDLGVRRLGVSRYDHCCRPTCTLVFDGFRAVLRPLGPAVDANDPARAFIAYVDVGRSRYQRRQELSSKWYFWCECERCMDPEDDRLTSMKCVNPECAEPILIAEDSVAEPKTCPSCHSVIDAERIIEAQTLMKSLPTRFDFSTDAEEVAKVRRQLDEAGRILHTENIYFCRLMTAYYQMDAANAAKLHPDLHKLVYNNYRRCLPEADRHIGYQLLHLVKSLIEEEKREDAIPYAFEAMTIFEVCFGLDHPYYLQTLALWTFLSNGADKTNDQLFSLMNFNYNVPVDITKYVPIGEQNAISAS